MIKSAAGLKAKVRNISKGDSKAAQAMIRIFFMERFLERVSLSKYKNQFVLKGGMLVSSLIGVNLRSTMDIDTTVKNLPLTKDELEKIIMEIIMDEFDYPGIRIHMEAFYSTCRKRETIFSKEKVEAELKNLSESTEMEEMWEQFKNKNYFVPNIEYSKIIKTIFDTMMRIYD